MFMLEVWWSSSIQVSPIDSSRSLSPHAFFRTRLPKPHKRIVICILSFLIRKAARQLDYINMKHQPAAEFDIILVGATGFTGALIAHWFTEHAPTTLKWALAGRSLQKLEACKSALSDRDRTAPSILVVDTSVEEQCVSLVKKAKVIVTTVGPYALLGESLLGACAKHGTHYCDLTGEVRQS